MDEWGVEGKSLKRELVCWYRLGKGLGNNLYVVICKIYCLIGDDFVVFVCFNCIVDFYLVFGNCDFCLCVVFVLVF